MLRICRTIDQRPILYGRARTVIVLKDQIKPMTHCDFPLRKYLELPPLKGALK